MKNKQRGGFTIIELLVVITIIVVLLALLTPALDKAIYQAELAMCSARLHAMGLGVTSYTIANKRKYPDRPYVRSNAGTWPNQMNAGAVDVRPLIAPYFSIDHVGNCPLSPKQVDLETRQRDDANRYAWAYSSYELWFGWQYGTGEPEKGMNRLGDRFTYTQAGDGSTPPIQQRFSLLASDTDVVRQNNAINYSSHPDAKGALTEWVMENEYYNQDNQEEQVSVAGTAAYFYVLSLWRSSFTERGPIDANYLSDDASVLRLDQVERLTDSRTALVPSVSKTVDTRWIQLAK